MELTTILYALITWFIIALAATLNGFIRNKLYKKAFGDLLAHQVSTIVLIGVIFFISYFFVKWTNTTSTPDLWIIGALWLIMTAAFEFLFGHYVMKHSWKKLLEDYNILKGRLWVLILIAVLIAPYIVRMLI